MRRSLGAAASPVSRIATNRRNRRWNASGADGTPPGGDGKLVHDAGCTAIGGKSPAMLQLHYYPGNASLIPHVLLEELGTQFELKHVDRTKNVHKSPDYLKLNPNGLIPVLV